MDQQEFAAAITTFFHDEMARPLPRQVGAELADWLLANYAIAPKSAQDCDEYVHCPGCVTGLGS